MMCVRSHVLLWCGAPYEEQEPGTRRKGRKTRGTSKSCLNDLAFFAERVSMRR